MIMNREQFCQTINAIRQIRLLQERVDEQFRYYRKLTKEDFAEFNFPTLELNLLQTLEIMFGDTETNYLSWWIYECDMGRVNDNLLTIIYPDKSEKIIKTETELYDLLISEMECG